MCVYGRAIFDCGHELWGRRIRLCTVAEEHSDGEIPNTCCLRVAHGLQSRKLSRKCDRCHKLEVKLAFIRNRLAECQMTLHRRLPKVSRPGWKFAMNNAIVL
jgi:hypothetical protein